MCAAICAVSCVATHLQVIDGKRVVCAVCCVAGCVAGCAVLCVVSKEACPRSLSREAVGRIRRLLGGQGSLPPKLVAGGRQEAKEAVAGGRSRGCSGAGSGGLGGCWRGLARCPGLLALSRSIPLPARLVVRSSSFAPLRSSLAASSASSRCARVAPAPSSLSLVRRSVLALFPRRARLVPVLARSLTLAWLRMVSRPVLRSLFRCAPSRLTSLLLLGLLVLACSLVFAAAALRSFAPLRSRLFPRSSPGRPLHSARSGSQLRPASTPPSPLSVKHS